MCRGYKGFPLSVNEIAYCSFLDSSNVQSRNAVGKALKSSRSNFASAFTLGTSMQIT